MNDHVYDIESVSKKFEYLDSELDTFLQEIQAIRELRSGLGDLPGRIAEHEAALDRQKKELEKLMSSANELLMSFEENAKGKIFELEKKTEELTEGVRPDGESQQAGVTPLSDKDRELLGELSRKYEDLRLSMESMKKNIHQYDQTLSTLMSNCSAAMSAFKTVEPSLTEMKKNIYLLQKKPYNAESRIREAEERLKVMIREKHARQKLFTWIIFILLIGFIGFSLFMDIML